jgi:cob(I)alamin adenosyltransferase
MLRVLYPLACASDRLRVLNFGRCKRLTPSPASFRMKVYTRTGDAGQTSLFNGRRVPKNDSRVEAYGTVDECNAAVGMACAHLSMRDVAAVGEYSADTEAALEGLRSRLESLQHRLFDLGAHLATPRDTSTQTKLDKTAFPSNAAQDIEAWIDDMEAALPPLKTFVLPGGHPSAAALHVARTIARRAERAVTPMLLGDEPQIDPAAYQFLNRLSDFFFVASRYANKLTGCSDVTWSKQHDTSRVP